MSPPTKVIHSHIYTYISTLLFFFRYSYKLSLYRVEWFAFFVPVFLLSVWIWKMLNAAGFIQTRPAALVAFRVSGLQGSRFGVFIPLKFARAQVLGMSLNPQDSNASVLLSRNPEPGIFCQEQGLLVSTLRSLRVGSARGLRLAALKPLVCRYQAPPSGERFPAYGNYLVSWVRAEQPMPSSWPPNLQSIWEFLKTWPPLLYPNTLQTLS